MNAPSFPLKVVAARPGDSALAQRLRKDVDGEVLFDAASRGRYSTDASIYQIEPIGVVVPRSAQAARAAIAIAARAASALRGTTTPIGSIW
jgi:FAD/FMN-containing dehydrogenase